MQGLVFLIRTALACVMFYYFVLDWALAPFLDYDINMNLAFTTIFFGTVDNPYGWVRGWLCLSRGAFGMILVVYFFTPGLRFFGEFEAEKYANTINIVLAGIMVAAYLAAVVTFHAQYT